ncbi:MAG: chloride channel protein [Planctomycetota bacterium]
MICRLRMITPLWIIRFLAIATTAVLSGSCSAAFLSLLDTATSLRKHHEWLILFLPFGGLASGWMYSKWGSSVEAGNNLVFDEIREPSRGIACRITPMVLLGTLITHLFGGSAGREGTAVQMAAGIGDLCRRWFRISGQPDRTLLLQTAVAAGFSGVFGTPIAGAFFALEVLRRRMLSTVALPCCLLASIIGDQSCLAWGATHTKYSIRPGLIAEYTSVDGSTLITVAIFMLAAAITGVVFGIATILFCRLTQKVGQWSKTYVRHAWLRPLIGGLCITTVYILTGNTDYLGLGVKSSTEESVSIVSSFQPNGAEPASWISKLVLTSVTVGTGFKGGEVTPLFFIGASLGNSVASWTGLPADWLAGLGFVCLFGAATKTPLTSLLMSVELFGGDYLPHFAIAICVALIASGDYGIYRSNTTPLTKSHLET